MHAAAPGMLSPQFPVPETSLQKSAGAPLWVMFPLNRLRKTLLLLELKISQPHVSSEEGLGFAVLPSLLMSLSDAQFPLEP